MHTVVEDRVSAAGAAVASTSRNIVQILLQHRWLVLLGGVLGLLGGILNYAQKQPIYQSGASVLVVKKRSDVLPVAGGDPRMTIYDDYIATHLMLIRSPRVISNAVDKKDLKKLKSFVGMSDPTGAILAGLGASRDGGKDGSASANIINLTFRGSEPEETGLVLAAVIASYSDFLEETYRSVSSATMLEIQNAQASLAKELKRKEDVYVKFRIDNPLMWRGADGANIHVVRIKELQNRQTGLIARSEELKERLAVIKQAKKDGSSSATLMALATRPLDRDSKDSSLEKEQESNLFPLMLKERALLQDYGDDHPEVVRVRDQIEMTKQFFQRIDAVSKRGAEKGTEAVKRMDLRLESHIEALRQELLLLESANASMTKMLKTEEAEARKLDTVEMQDDSLKADMARTSLMLGQTMKRLEEINLVKESGGFDAKVITEPGIGSKVSPIAFQIIMSGLVIGLFLGMGGAYLLDVADKSFRTPEEIRKRLGLPIVGHIPYLAQTNDPVAVINSDGDSVQVDASLCTYHRPNSLDSEAYRSVRTSLYFSTQGERHKVIQVTSPNMSDGKTTLIANLAVAIAQSGRRVILVDADLRRPRVHRMFGLTAKAGLAQLITDEAELPDVVQQTVVPNLSVMPAGPRPAAPGELLTQQRLAEILDLLRDQYDYVLIDTPPLLAVSDPCAVAPRVDGVLLTIRVSKNGRPSAERARDMLAGLKVHVFGVVVNGTGKQGAMKGYGYEHYDYAYSYTSEYTSDGDEENPEAASRGEAK